MNHQVIDPQSLTLSSGGKWHGSYGVAPCPCCQPERRKEQAALSISCDEERLLLHCKKLGCDFRDIISGLGLSAGRYELDHEKLKEAQRKKYEQEAYKLKQAREIWKASKPIDGTYGETYLRGRGITCPLPSSLRWNDNLYHGPSCSRLCGIVAKVSSGGIHRTYFTKEGKRLTQHAKAMYGPCSGGGVALNKSDSPNLVIGEGIETTLSLLSGLYEKEASYIATLSTSGMKAFNLPSAPARITIATDGDTAGQEAGHILAERASSLGWKVCTLPAPQGKDWNDILRMGVAA